MPTVDSDLALTAFAAARDGYLEAMRRLPPHASEYLKPGDDYSVGGIAIHVNQVLEHYINVLQVMIAGGFEECRPQDPDGQADRANARAKLALRDAELARELDQTQTLHQQVQAIVTTLGSDLERRAPVWYPGGKEPHPTSAADVLGWLSDHYREHVPQLDALVAEWRLGREGDPIDVVNRFCEAFDRCDVDGVMALMTADCIFESTAPAPDGERHTGQVAVRQYWEAFFGSTQQPRFENEEMFAAGDRVISRWRFSWGEGATGGHVRGIDVYRVREGRVSEKLAYVKG